MTSKKGNQPKNMAHCFPKIGSIVGQHGSFYSFYARTYGLTCNLLWGNCAHVTIFIDPSIHFPGPVYNQNTEYVPL